MPDALDQFIEANRGGATQQSSPVAPQTQPQPQVSSEDALDNFVLQHGGNALVSERDNLPAKELFARQGQKAALSEPLHPWSGVPDEFLPIVKAFGGANFTPDKSSETYDPDVAAQHTENDARFNAQVMTPPASVIAKGETPLTFGEKLGQATRLAVRTMTTDLAANLLKTGAVAGEAGSEFAQQEQAPGEPMLTTSPTASPLYKAGEAVEAYGQKIHQVSPQFEQSLAGRITAGVSQLPALIGAGLLGGPVGVGVVGASQFTGPAVDAAKKAGASAEEQEAVGAGNAVIGYGGTILPVESVLHPIARVSETLGDTVVAATKNAIRSGAIGSTVNAVMQFGSNLVKKFTYDATQDPFEGVPQAAEFGGVAGIVGGAVGGAISTPEFPMRPTQEEQTRAIREAARRTFVPPAVAAARDVGAIGGTDAEYFGTQSPEFIKGSQETAAQAPATPVAPTPGAIARQRNPDLFNEADQLESHRAALNDLINDLQAQRTQGTSPRVRELDAQINDLRAKQLEATGRDKRDIANQVINLEEEREAALPKTGDTPEIARVRQDLTDTRNRLNDLGPQIYAATRDAEGAAPVEPSVETQAQASTPASPQAPIAQIVKQQLVAAGRPEHEAEIAGAVEQAAAEVRAARWGGRRGTAEEMFAREGTRYRGEGQPAPTNALELAQGPAPTDVAAEIRNAIESKVADSMTSIRMQFRPGTEAYERAVQRARDLAGDWINQPEGRDYLEAQAESKGADYAKDLKDYLSRSYQAVAEGQPFRANVNRMAALEQAGRRGAGRRGGFDPLNRITTIMRNGDASTFIHEAGHAYLKRLMDDAAEADAPEGIKADAAIVLKWTGIKDIAEWQRLEAEWQRSVNAGGRLTPDARRFVKAHEQFARGWEQYFFHGIAPSPKLARAFAQFKAWLTKIYKTVDAFRGLHGDQPISEEIRGVYDRLLAEKPQRTVYTGEVEGTPNIADHAEAVAANVDAMPPRVAETQADLINQQIAAELTEVAPELADEVARTEPTGVGAGAEEGATPRGVRNEGRPETGAAGAGEPVGTGGGRGGGAPPPGGTGERPPSAGGSRDEESYITAARNIVDENDANRILDQVGRDHGWFAGVKGHLSDQERNDAAAALGLDPATLTQELQTAISKKHPLEVLVWAARTMLPKMVADFENAERTFAASKTDLDAAAYLKAQEKVAAMWNALMPVRATSGRVQRAFHRTDGFDAFKQAQNISEFFQDATGKTVDELHQQAVAGAANRDPKSAPRRIRQNTLPTTAEKINSAVNIYGVNNWLSNPLTHAFYALVNQVMTLKLTQIDIRLAAMMRKEGQVGYHYADARQATLAMVSGIRTGWLAARRSLRMGVPVYGAVEEALARAPDQLAAIEKEIAEKSDQADNMRGDAGQQMRDEVSAAKARLSDLRRKVRASEVYRQRWQQQPPGVVKTALTGAVHSVSAIHTFGYFQSFETRAVMRSIEKARLEGIPEGPALYQRAATIRENLPLEDLFDLHEQAMRDVLMGKLRPDSALWSFTQAINRLGAFGRFIAPFPRIMNNIIERAASEEPLIYRWNKRATADLQGLNGEHAQNLRQGAIAGTVALMAPIIMGNLMGFTQGAGPLNPKDRWEWEQNGNLEFSVRVPGGRMPTSKLGPIAIFFDMANMYADVAKGVVGALVSGVEGDKAKAEADLENAAHSVVGTVTHIVMEDFFLKDLEGFVEELGRNGWSQFPQSAANSLISYGTLYSSMLRQFSVWADPYRRRVMAKDWPGRMLETFESGIPFVSRNLQPDLDVFGNPIPTRSSVAISWDREQNAAMAALQRIKTGTGWWPSTVRNEINGHSLPEAEYTQYLRISGQKFYERAQAIASAPSFAKKSIEAQRQAIEDAKTQADKDARNAMMDRDHALRNRIGKKSLMDQSTEAKQSAIRGYAVGQ